mmetsp:Transcript_29321/g.93834  ORF Transcript_29321/g.93834 Transcript_29321/m.93834 type:complete len:210 (-) Transcript_29321:30-659(-)
MLTTSTWCVSSLSAAEASVSATSCGCTSKASTLHPRDAERREKNPTLDPTSTTSALPWCPLQFCPFSPRTLTPIEAVWGSDTPLAATELLTTVSNLGWRRASRKGGVVTVCATIRGSPLDVLYCHWVRGNSLLRWHTCPSGVFLGGHTICEEEEAALRGAALPPLDGAWGTMPPPTETLAITTRKTTTMPNAARKMAGTPPCGLWLCGM